MVLEYYFRMLVVLRSIWPQEAQVEGGEADGGWVTDIVFRHPQIETPSDQVVNSVLGWGNVSLVEMSASLLSALIT